jgi:hypothetical protein
VEDLGWFTGRERWVQDYMFVVPQVLLWRLQHEALPNLVCTSWPALLHYEDVTSLQCELCPVTHFARARLEIVTGATASGLRRKGNMRPDLPWVCLTHEGTALI